MSHHNGVLLKSNVEEKVILKKEYYRRKDNTSELWKFEVYFLAARKSTICSKANQLVQS